MSEKSKRIAMSVFGVVVCGLSVGLLRHAALGVDPFQSLMSGLDAVIPLRFGTLYVLANVLLLLFSLVFDRRKIGLATFINLFLLGYVAEFSQKAVEHLFPSPALGTRLLLLAVGIVAICLASAFYFTADLGVSTYDAVSLIISEKQSKVAFKYCRIISDVICVVLGFLLCKAGGFSLAQIGGEIGIGTIITAFFMGPLIAFFNERVARPFLFN